MYGLQVGAEDAFVAGVGAQYTGGKVEQRDVVVAGDDKAGRGGKPVHEGTRRCEFRPSCALCDVAGQDHQIGLLRQRQAFQGFDDRRAFSAEMRVRNM